MSYLVDSNEYDRGAANCAIGACDLWNAGSKTCPVSSPGLTYAMPFNWHQCTARVSVWMHHRRGQSDHERSQFRATAHTRVRGWFIEFA